MFFFPGLLLKCTANACTCPGRECGSLHACHAVGLMQNANACNASAVEIAGVRDTPAAAMPVMRIRGGVDHVLTAHCIVRACGICSWQAAADAVVVIEVQHA